MTKKTTFVLLITVFIFCVIIGTFFLVDLNLVFEGNIPKFCIKQVEYEGKAIEYTGFFYKIIKYYYGDNFEVKYGGMSLKYDEEYSNKLNDIDVSGVIESITTTSKGAYQLYITSSTNKAYVVYNSSTIVMKNEVKSPIELLKTGIKVEIKLKEDNSSDYPQHGVAEIIYIVE